MTAEEMRKIALGGDFDAKVKKFIADAERWIREAAEKGKTSTHFCSYSLCEEYQREAMKHFERNGFSFRVEQRVVGGVLQHPGYYIHW